MKRLAIVTTHPVQYNAPWFKMLSAFGKIRVKVFYTWSQVQQEPKFDPGFGKIIQWDIPLLEGYEFEFVENISNEPGSHHFKGIVNPSLNKKIELWNANAILVFGWSFKSHLQCLRYFKGKVPVLFRGDSTLLDEQPGMKKWMRRFFLKWVYGSIDYALYVGQNNKNYFLLHGLNEHQLIFAPHAVDNDRFYEPDDRYCSEAISWREKAGITEKDLVILFAGKLEPKKNPRFLLDIAEKITSEDLKIVIVGNGVLEDSLKQDARDDHRIIFLDFQNQQQMPIVYRMGDIFILPSNGPGETWGLAVNEAMACGCAVMMSDKCGGAIDLIQDGKNGIIFKTNDIETSVQFINTLLANRQTLQNMKMASRRLITTFSFEQIVKSVETLVENIGE